MSVSVTVPVAAPVAVGSNSIESVVVWLGFNVIGKFIPEILNPVPVTDPALIVSGAVPDDVNNTVCVDGVFSVTSPNDTLVD